MIRQFELEENTANYDTYFVYEFGKIVGECGSYWSDLVRELLIVNGTITKHEVIEVYWR